LPIVAVDVGGVPDLVRDGVEALLVAPGDAAALAAGIGRLLTNRALAVRLGRQAAVRQRKEFELGAVVRRLEELYMRLLGGQPVHQRALPIALAGEMRADG
jgi:glycosyltransferase involved in cell wall biosynthesis